MKTRLIATAVLFVLLGTAIATLHAIRERQRPHFPHPWTDETRRENGVPIPVDEQGSMAP